MIRENVVLVVVIDVDGSNRCAGVDMLDLGEEGCKASNERRHPLILVLPVGAIESSIIDHDRNRPTDSSTMNLFSCLSSS